jgi:hypothetical protein
LTVLLNDVWGGARWAEQEYEIATIDYRVKLTSPTTGTIKIQDLQVTTDDATFFRPVNAIAFLESAPQKAEQLASGFIMDSGGAAIPSLVGAEASKCAVEFCKDDDRRMMIPGGSLACRSL